MSRIFLLFFSLTLIVACSQELPTEKKAVNQQGKSEQIASTPKILNWGPNETLAGVNPNPQPDEGVGIWIKLSTKLNAKNIQVFINETKATNTVVDGNLITASLPMSAFMNQGIRIISLKSPDMQEALIVGDFIIK